MKGIRIGFISDTHNLLREEVMEEIKKCNYIIHAGDISNEETYLALNDIGNITFVRGNNDKDDWANGLNKSEVVEIDGFKICVVHDIKDLPKKLEGVDLVVFGHSHKYFYEEVNGVIFLNPGSCGKKRFSLPLSFAIGILEQNRIKIIKHDL